MSFLHDLIQLNEMATALSNELQQERDRRRNCVAVIDELEEKVAVLQRLNDNQYDRIGCFLTKLDDVHQRNEKLQGEFDALKFLVSEVGAIEGENVLLRAAAENQQRAKIKALDEIRELKKQLQKEDTAGAKMACDLYKQIDNLKIRLSNCAHWSNSPFLALVGHGHALGLIRNEASGEGTEI